MDILICFWHIRNKKTVENYLFYTFKKYIICKNANEKWNKQLVLSTQCYLKFVKLVKQIKIILFLLAVFSVKYVSEILGISK